ncbi:NAD(P)-dependent oxidoreductase [Aliarcobacter cryaerophilus]|uniref:NAD-dependent epimerase/dehydratase family protein n=1 Tax=Aliarcobacter cryaerophilus TaxID=28198 RepID=UPI00164C0EAB|nr:NAD(P)-dependent oxidoreductase [Aliarcobacter cryaerophilus]QNK84315.1 NAD(P)-dependent oxidoreductase [Aliarcobacter cryaerophilus]
MDYKLMTTILVTGATGYIGREFVKKYNQKYNLIAIVRETSDIIELELLKCKIVKFKNFKEIENIFSTNKIDGILHFASNVIVEHKEEEINTLVDSNIKYGTYLLENCKKYNVKWFINTGTFWQNYNSDNYNPVNLYAATKEAFNNIAKYYTETSALIFTTIKLNDTFGTNDKRDKIFNIWNKISKTGETLEMSAGEQIIDISYIEDVTNAFNIMIQNLEKNKEQYNNKYYIVSSKQRITLRELANLFEKCTKKKLNINWGSRLYREREVMIPYNKGQLIPNWEQKYTLEEAIIKTIGDNY